MSEQQASVTNIQCVDNTATTDVSAAGTEVAPPRLAVR
jgi:hypothetical protein